jgi:hypothetical protein
VSGPLPFHPPAFKDGKKGPDTQAKLSIPFAVSDLAEFGLLEFGLLEFGLAEFGLPELGLDEARDRLVIGGEILSGI